MNDYNKNYFWTMIDPITLEKKYLFNLNGIKVEVSKEVYYVCFKCYVNELRRNRKTAEIQILSIDKANKDGHAMIDSLQSKDDIPYEVNLKILYEIAMEKIRCLNEDDQKIITEIFLNDRSLRSVSRELGIPVMTLHYRINKILKRLKKEMLK